MKRALMTTAAIFAAVLMISVPAMGYSYTWAGGTTDHETDWNVATNWTPNDGGSSYPGSGDAATIPPSCANYPQLETSVTVGSLTIQRDATVATSTRTLTIEDSNGLTIDPNDGGTLPGQLNVSSGGTVVLSGGGTSQTVDGLLNLQGSGSTLSITTASCTINGSGSIVGGNASAVIGITQGYILTLDTNATIKGELSIQPVAGTNDATFTNNGTVNANGGLMTIQPDAVGAGSGDWTVAAGHEMWFVNCTVATQSGDFTNNGTLDIDASVSTSGELNASAGSVIEVMQGTSFQALSTN